MALQQLNRTDLPPIIVSSRCPDSQGSDTAVPRLSLPTWITTSSGFSWQHPPQTQSRWCRHLLRGRSPACLHLVEGERGTMAAMTCHCSHQLVIFHLGCPAHYPSHHSAAPGEQLSSSPLHTVGRLRAPLYTQNPHYQASASRASSVPLIFTQHMQAALSPAPLALNRYLPGLPCNDSDRL